MYSQNQKHPYHSIKVIVIHYFFLFLRQYNLHRLEMH